MKKPYQDIWRNGRLVAKGRRECEKRYQAIRTVLEGELGRGFSVADVGGWDGYFAVRLAEDLGAKATNIDSRDIKLPCHRRMKVTADNIGQIGFNDAILTLSVLHHMPDWQEVYEGLKRQCLLLVVEVCHPDEAKGSLSPVMRETAHRVDAIYEAVRADAVETIIETPCLDRPTVKRPMFLVRRGVLGTVEAGTGKAAALMRETAPKDWRELGYEPYPGTLNVAVSEVGWTWLKSLPGVKAPGLKRSPHYVPVQIRDIEGHVHFARSPGGRPEKVIELVSPVSFRDAGYTDGSRIRVVAR